MVEVSWEAGGGGLQQLVVIRDILPEARENDGHVHNGLLIVAGLEAHLQAALI